jgi:hypothetical protein
MVQTAERNKAIEKIRKLRDRAAGGGSSETEVEFAMKTMGELMDTFNISMDEVSLAAEECKMITIGHTDGSVFRLGTVSVAVANFCDCVTYYTKGPKVQKRRADGSLVYDTKNGRAHYEKPLYNNHFYGIESDAETAAYLMEMIRKSAVSAVDEFKKTDAYLGYHGNKTVHTKSFVDGFASRMVRRLNTLKDERESELEAAREARAEMGESEANLDAERMAHLRRQGHSTDLVALKDQKVKDDFKAKYGWSVKYRSSRGSGYGSYGGRVAGGNAADKVNLSRPVGNGGGHSGQLKLAQG